MPNGPLCFVHAADLHLEAPVLGVPDAPQEWKDRLLEAPYRAAERVFDTVINERADLLVLAGDVLAPAAAGPRAVAFLVVQFERLEAAGVPVYWAGGRADGPRVWPAGVRLPGNVHRFAEGEWQEVVFERDGVRLARLVGCSASRRQRPSGFPSSSRSADDVFSIGVTYGRVDKRLIQASMIDYWALGGRHQGRTLCQRPAVVHYPGSPQGRRRGEWGEHGCTVVRVNEEGHVHTGPVWVDELRLESAEVAVGGGVSRSELEAALDERMRAVLDSAGGRSVLVWWRLVGGGAELLRALGGCWAEDVLGWLRERYGRGQPAAWSVAVEVKPAAELPSQWDDGETIRSDFLQAVRRFRARGPEAIQLERYLPDGEAGQSWAALRAIKDEAAWEELLSRAALLGAALLSGEETRS